MNAEKRIDRRGSFPSRAAKAYASGDSYEANGARAVSSAPVKDLIARRAIVVGVPMITTH